jgi:hypothetical protein
MCLPRHRIPINSSYEGFIADDDVASTIHQTLITGMTDFQVARQWLKAPPQPAKLLEADLLKGQLQVGQCRLNRVLTLD